MYKEKTGVQKVETGDTDDEDDTASMFFFVGESRPKKK